MRAYPHVQTGHRFKFSVLSLFRTMQIIIDGKLQVKKTRESIAYCNLKKWNISHADRSLVYYYAENYCWRPRSASNINFASQSTGSFASKTSDSKWK